MNASAVKDMFLDIVGGTSLDDAVIDKVYEDSVTFLNQRISHTGADFINDHTLLLLITMQYYYDMVQRNFDDAAKNRKEILQLVQEVMNDYTQDEQVEQVNHMGDQ